MKKKGVSSEALKVAAAMFIALIVFAMLLSFAITANEADTEAEGIGQRLLDYTQNTSSQVIGYGS